MAVYDGSAAITAQNTELRGNYVNNIKFLFDLKNVFYFRNFYLLMF